MREVSSNLARKTKHQLEGECFTLFYILSLFLVFNDIFIRWIWRVFQLFLVLVIKTINDVSCLHIFNLGVLVQPKN